MPNTLFHVGVQGSVARGLYRPVDLEWVFLGVMIPDLPWILQRVVAAGAPAISPYDLRLYVVAQSSLFVCAALCGAIAVVSTKPPLAFLVLWANCGLHLLLDALQCKFANGVHFLAPVSWAMTNLGLFWPENSVSVGLTLLSAVLAIYWYFFCRPTRTIRLSFRPLRRTGMAFVLATSYVLLPLVLLDGPWDADNHSVRALAMRDTRAGRPVEFDRNRLVVTRSRTQLITFAGEQLDLLALPPGTESGTISIRGQFIDENTVRVDEFHIHVRGFRDWASYAGIGLIVLFWVSDVLGIRATRNNAAINR